MENLQIAGCKVCGLKFERDENRSQGRLVSCPAHSFGEIELEDYHRLGLDPDTGEKIAIV